MPHAARRGRGNESRCFHRSLDPQRSRTAICCRGSRPSTAAVLGQRTGGQRSWVAYAEVAAKENDDATLYKRSFELLRQAEPKSPRDAKLLVQLATLYERYADEDHAMQLYQRAIHLDPDQVTAAINLGSCYAKRGRLPEAMHLWQDALRKNPALESTGLNLGVAQARTGDVAAARNTLQSVLHYNPDSAAARTLLRELAQ